MSQTSLDGMQHAFAQAALTAELQIEEVSKLLV